MSAIRGDLDDRLADELERAGGLLEGLAVTLCLDPVVFERHAGDLQRFDQITQIIGEIAGVLRCRGTRDEAIGAIRLDTIKERLNHAK